MMRFIWWLVLAVLAVVGIGLLGTARQPARSDTTLMVMRDLNELRFMNEGPVGVFDCTVTIDGGFSAVLHALPVGQRQFITRAQFSETLPRDEFYTRILRSVTISACRDGQTGSAEPVTVTIK